MDLGQGKDSANWLITVKNTVAEPINVLGKKTGRSFTASVADPVPEM